MERHSSSWIGRPKIAEISFCPNVIYRFNVISMKIPASYFVDNNMILKCIWRGKISGTVNKTLKEKNKTGGVTLPKIESYYKAMII